MEPTTIQRLRQAFEAYGDRCRPESPLAADLAAALGDGPSPAALDLFGRFFRIISAAVPNIPLLIAAVHHQALRGEAPALARLFPTCGGSYAPAADREALAAAAQERLAESREDLLDFMLSYSPVRDEPRRGAALLLGALAAAERFGGGLSVVEIGAGGGLHLLFDRYDLMREVAVRSGGATLAPLLERGLPPVVGRLGLEPEPRDLTDPDQALLSLAFRHPDDADGARRLRQAVALLSEQGVPEIRQGTPEEDLAPLLVDAYNAMPAGNTLLLFQTGIFPYQADWQQQAMTLAVQRLAAQIQSHKPVAWLQAEPFTPGSRHLDLRLHTFGWRDPEEREVRKLGEAAPDLAWVDWLGSYPHAG